VGCGHATSPAATRIYDGQFAVAQLLSWGAAAPGTRSAIRRNSNSANSPRSDALVRARQVRPTVLTPLWHVAGYARGAASALLGERVAMACTVAVEEVIDEHYRTQGQHAVRTAGWAIRSA
jgi:ubiquinone biosynthesis monooxygenase Coq7